MKKFMWFAAIFVIAMGSNAFANGAPAAAPCLKVEPPIDCSPPPPKCDALQTKHAVAEQRACEEFKGEGAKYVALTCFCDLSQVNNPERKYAFVAFCDLSDPSGKGRPDGIREVNPATDCRANERLTANARWEAGERKKEAAKLRKEFEAQIGALQDALDKAASTDEVEAIRGKVADLDGRLKIAEHSSSYAVEALEGDGTSENPGLKKRLEELKRLADSRFKELERRVKATEDRLDILEAIVAELKKSKLGFGFSGLLALQPEVAKGLVRARGGNAFALQPAFLLAVGQTRLTIEFGRVAEQGHAPDKTAASYWGNVGGVSAAYLFQPAPNLGIGPTLGVRVKATNSTLAFSNARAIGTTLNLGAAFEWAISDSWRLNAGLGLAYEWNRASFDGVEQIGSGLGGSGSIGVGYYF